MPGVDWIPGLSQAKAIAQIITGDKDGAATTIENFHAECPGVSQLTSLVQLAKGDLKGAKETQKRCFGTLSNVANGTPIVGHLKAIGHLLARDREGADQAFNAANRSTVVVGSGLAAGLASGGLSAVPAGVLAGTWYDIAATKITGKDQGCIAALRKAIDDPSAATIIDAVAVPLGDGLAGYSGGQIAEQLGNATAQPQSVGTKAKLSSLEATRGAKLDLLNDGIGGGKGMNTGQAVALGNEIKALTSEISLIKDGTPKFWTDLKSANPQTNPVTVPILGTYDKKNETIRNIPPNIPGPVVVVGTPAATAFTPGLTERSTLNDKNVAGVKPWDYSILRHYSYEHQQNIFKLCNGQKSEKEYQRGFAPSVLEESDDAIYYDAYWNDLFVEQYNYKARENTLKLFNSQKPEKELSLESVPLFSEKNLKEVRDLNNRRPYQPENNAEEIELNRMLNWSWLHLDLPEEIPYTALIQLNNVSEGLNHSFNRHYEQWREFISFDQELIDRLQPIREDIDAIQSATSHTNYVRGVSSLQDRREQGSEVRQQTKEAERKLKNTLQKMKQSQPEQYRNVERALLRIQIAMHEFIQNNITSCQYIRTVTNADDLVQLHFKVKTRNGETKVMVVTVSKEIYSLPNVAKRPIRTVKTIYFKPWYDDALFYDSYLKNSWDDVVPSECSKEEKENMLNFREKHKPTKSLDLRSVPLLSQGQLKMTRICNSYPNMPEPFSSLYWFWLHLKLPENADFSYTTFIQLNNDNDGLLYSLIRHLDQWREFISIDNDLINRLTPIITDIEEIYSATEDSSTGDSKNAKNQTKEARMKAEEAKDKLRDALKKLKKALCQDVKMALLRIQILLYDFMENNVTSCHFLRRTFNADGLEQLHFKVQTLNGETKVMVICVSIDLYQQVLSVDKRPIRKVMAVFFKSWGDYNDIFETKDGKEEE